MKVSVVCAFLALFVVGAFAATQTVVVGPGGALTFEPDTLDAKVGDTIIFNWDSDFHTVTQTENAKCSSPYIGFDSGILNTGDSFKYVVNQTGTIYYVCQPHCILGMKAVINAS